MGYVEKNLLPNEPIGPLRLYLIRHGETRWSLSGQHTGRTDIELTPNGENQARGLGPLLSKVEFAQVLSSPLLRARQTCDLSGLGPRARVEPDLAEWDYGDYEGQRSIDIRQLRPGWSLWDDGCPNGEAPADVCARADRLIASLRTSAGSIALFTHAQFAATLAARWIGLALREGRHFPLDPASISILGRRLDEPYDATMLRWNSV